MNDQYLLNKNLHNIISGYFDEYGKPCKRTPLTNPYNYDGYVIWQTEGKPNSTIYSNRLLQWDWNKHNTLYQKHFGDNGQRWENREPGKIEAFLQDWENNQNLKLIRVMQYCNQASGYPVWRFDISA